MPIYSFKCEKCGREDEFIRKMGDFTEPLCVDCDLKMEKQMPFTQRPKFNCSGFYETDYKLHEDRKNKSIANYKNRIKMGEEHTDPYENQVKDHIPLTKPKKKN